MALAPLRPTRPLPQTATASATPAPAARASRTELAPVRPSGVRTAVGGTFVPEPETNGVGYEALREKAPRSLMQKLIPSWMPFIGKGPSTGKAGWALENAAPTTDKTADFRTALEAAKAGRNTLPPDAKDYKYLVVSGLMGEHGPTYLNGNIERMRKLGLSTHEVAIDTEAATLTNARILKDAILQASHSGKKVVLMGHSKGGVDITAALAIYPELKQHVHAVATIQTPFGGSPIAEDIHSSWTLRTLLGNGLGELVFGGSPDVIRDLSYSGRQEFLAEYPYPTDIPTTSLATSRISPASLLYPIAQYTWQRYGERSDGLVVDKDAMIPGSQTIVLDDMDHIESTLEGVPGLRNYRPGDVTQALLTVALEGARKQQLDAVA